MGTYVEFRELLQKLGQAIMIVLLHAKGALVSKGSYIRPLTSGIVISPQMLKDTI